MKIPLTAEPRTDFGKGAARRLRRAGRVPAVMYGAKREVVHISLPEHELALGLRRPAVTFEIELAGATTLVKPRDVQRDPVRRDVEHVDLIVIDAAEAQARAVKSAKMTAAAEAAAEAAAKAAPSSGAVEAAPAESAESAESTEPAEVVAAGDDEAASEAAPEAAPEA